MREYIKAAGGLFLTLVLGITFSALILAIAEGVYLLSDLITGEPLSQILGALAGVLSFCLIGAAFVISTERMGRR